MQRPEKVNASYCQNAFDMAVIHLSNRLDNIRLDMCRECKSIFTTSKVLFAMSIDGRSKTEMIRAELLDAVSFLFLRFLYKRFYAY